MLSAKEFRKRIQTGTCAVLGLGISNLPLVDCLLALGADVTVRDKKSVSELGDAAVALSGRGVRFVTGEGYLDGITEDVLFRSPGIRPDAGGIPAAVARGAILSSEMEWFFLVSPAPIFAVTGSDGKTTTTTLTKLFLEAAAKRAGHGTVFTGGNIGEPLLPHVGEMTDADVAVVELSSFQLMTMQQSPARAAITNLSPNHLNWHKDMEEYRHAKCNVFRHMRAGGVAVLNAENEADRDIGMHEIPKGVAVTWFSSEKTTYAATALTKAANAVYRRDGVMYFCDGNRETAVMPTNCIRLPGKHNLENYMTAVALTWGLVPTDAVREVAQAFAGVPHRLEVVRTLHGVKYYNSSIDSSPTRTIAALSALSTPPVVICGGRDKHVPFDSLAEALCARARAVILTGEAAEQIRAAILSCSAYDAGRLPVVTVPGFADAVAAAKETAERLGATDVLLSPACTSFDAFRNFEERGETFRTLVNGWRDTDEN